MGNDSLTQEDVALALRKAKMKLEQERRQQFRAFDIAEDCLWPCSRLFHRHSSLGVGWIPALSVSQVEALTQDGRYKRYPAAPKFVLPLGCPMQADLESTIRSRRSRSDFSGEPISLVQLAKLLELGCGVTADGVPAKRAAPSGGALYPVETYVAVMSVEGLSGGLYHYVPLDHSLEQLRRDADLSDLKSFVPPRILEGRPSLAIILSAVFARTQMKYIERGYRFVLLEAGHIAQNLLLGAHALGLGAVPVGGFWDEPFNDFMRLNMEEEAVIYSVFIGRTA
jgi:SagB-type dehydrogenase family enzyme